LRPVAGAARVIDSQQEWRCLMLVVIVLSPIASMLGFGLGESFVVGAGP
jgi:hypothetical protein